MAHSLIITAYNPDFTPIFKAWIKKHIKPSMINADDDSEKSYFLQTIIQESQETHALTEEDNIYIKELLSQNVEYVEF